MEIRIKEKGYEYTSDFPDGWKFSRGDYFKFPVSIGPNNCFIKRFDKRTDTIAGWNLLNDLSEKYEPNLARVYYVAGDHENTTIVNYVFFEYIEGKTLHELIAKKVPFDLAKLTDGLFAALQALQKRGHWFPDFFEKNMFVSRSGNFLLIDLDSAQPLQDLPDKEMWGCKDYWAQVFKFCQEILHLTDIKPSYFHGSSFNYLHAVFLILRLKIFYLNEEVEYDDVAFFNQLPQHLNNISPSFKKIFSKVCENRSHPLEVADINEIKQLIITEILPLTDAGFNGIVINKNSAQPAVAINSFEVINYMEQQADTFVIASGETFKLKWKVQNANEIELYKNGTFLQRFNDDHNTIEITEEVFDDQPKKIEYRLVATYDLTKDARALIIEIVPPFTNLAISDFSVRDYVDKNNEVYTVQSGMDFTLQWNVRNAQKIELLKNGEQTTPFTNNENNVTLNEEAWDGKERTIEYTLVVSHNDESIESVEKTSLKVKLIYQQQDIEAFTVKSFLQKNNNEYVVESGKPFTLGWDLTEAREMEVLKNGQPFKIVPADENNISITETAYDGKEQKITYTLVSPASKTRNKSSRSVTVLVQKTTSEALVIKAFKTSKGVIRGSGFFKLSWVVENASRLALYKSGIFYKEIQSNETSIELQENYEGSVKHLRYLLYAANEKEEIRSETVDVFVKSKISILTIILIAAALLGFVVLLYFVIPFFAKETAPAFNAANFKMIRYGDTVTLTGTYIPEKDNSVVIRFNEVKANIVQLRNDSLSVQVPKLPSGISDVNITATIANKVYPVAQHIKYYENSLKPEPAFSNLPAFTHFTKDVIIQNEIITIMGHNLPLGDTSIQVYLNKVHAKIIQQTPDSIRVLIPELKDRFVNITARMAGTDIPLAQDLLYQKSEIPPSATTVDPINLSVVTEGNTISISGVNLPTKKGDLKVRFNNVQATILVQTSKILKVKVPSLPKDINDVNISVVTKTQVYKVGDHISYQPILIEIFTSTQTKTSEGANFFISGKNIPMSPGAVEVLFNNIKARITDQNQSLIQVKVPSMPLNTKQVNIVIHVNGKEHIVANNMVYQPLQKPVNVCEFAITSFKTYKTGVLGLGNKHVELTLTNTSKYIMQTVTVAIDYIKNGTIQETEEMTFNSMEPGASVKQKSKKNIDSREVKISVLTVKSNEFGLQNCK